MGCRRARSSSKPQPRCTSSRRFEKRRSRSISQQMWNDGMGRAGPGSRAACSARDSDGLAEPDKRFGGLSRLLEDVITWPPATRFAKNNNCRAAKTEKRFFGSPLERLIQRVDLDDPPHGHGADFNEGDYAEILRIQNADVAFVDEQDIVFVLERLPMHR